MHCALPFYWQITLHQALTLVPQDYFFQIIFIVTPALLFFYCEGQSRLRQLTCHILEQLVKRPNFPKGEFQLYQLTHKPYIETYG